MKQHFVTHRGFYLFLLFLGCVAFVVYIGLSHKGFFDPVPVESVDYNSMIDTASVKVLAGE